MNILFTTSLLNPILHGKGGGILPSEHKRSQEGPGGPPPPIEIPQMIKNYDNIA